jgi:hypothetical protein
MRAWVFVVLLSLTGSVVQAQPVTSYSFAVSNKGAASPFQTTPIAVAAFLCGQTPKLPPITTAQANPSKIAFDDPADATKDCVFVDNGSGPLLSLPFGNQTYTATIAAVNAVGVGPASTVSNDFTRPGVVAAALTGLRVTK